jgi:hypothetical protein
VKFKGKSIADVLDMTVEEARSSSRPSPRSATSWTLLNEVGLGYIKVGQQATTLSGGEAQRVKLAKELSAAHRPHALHPRRADHRPAFRGRAQAARSAARAGRAGQHGGGDRAQPRRHQDRRLDHRPRPRGRRRRRSERSRPYPCNRTRFSFTVWHKGAATRGRAGSRRRFLLAVYPAGYTASL